ncbi:MAG TPA: formylglycine-generating enzyme family protein [Cyanobacteria bacterium UBA8803]|nr:formylglycine-generating enzyme family protein [Cyanobacteria bacterium UBA9273]HBL60504.1 formylglycine-generating enzyme family protein [Cyanobacteria bacterium UBA8803]
MVKLVIRKEQGQVQYYTEFLDEGIGLEMTWVPGGTFLMGSPENEPERRANEGPQRLVTVPSFFMGRYPITQAQWRVVARWEPVERELQPDPSQFKNDPPQPLSIPRPSSFKGKPEDTAPRVFSRWDRPVEQVSWYDAKEFCARLSQRTKKEYRLPTEAEWEYACRAGTTTPFHFGNIITTDYVNYNGNYTYGDSPKGEYRGETTPVGYFNVANPFGLYDMHGNVYEWCEDDYHQNYENAPTDGSAWLSSDKNTTKIIRGGCWNFYPYSCRCAYRDRSYPDYRNIVIGLRVVRAAARILP